MNLIIGNFIMAAIHACIMAVTALENFSHKSQDEAHLEISSQRFFFFSKYINCPSITFQQLLTCSDCTILYLEGLSLGWVGVV